MEKRLKGPDEIFCSSCGEPVKKEAVICVHCGVPIKEAHALGYSRPKSKAVAVVLAVFLSCFTWLYTYKIDAWKFFLTFGLILISIIIDPEGYWSWLPVLVTWAWAIIETATRPRELYENYPHME